MKRIWALLAAVMLLGGCSGDREMEEALEIRSRLLAASDIRFEAEVGADYIDSFERFTLECSFDGTGRMTFVAEEPEDIAGLSGSCTGTEGTVEFDDTVLAFPLMADGRLSPTLPPAMLMWVGSRALPVWLVMAAAMTVGEWRFHVSFWTMSTGRVPPCSLPTTGLRSA